MASSRILGQHPLHVLDLALGDVRREHRGHRTGRPLWIEVVIAPELLLDAEQE